jgi:hypothetical protein
LFFVDGNSATSVASTMVPSRIINPFGEVSVDCVEDLARRFICFEQVAKLEQRRRVRRHFAAQVDANEIKNGLAVVDHISNALDRQTKTSLGHVHPPHALQTDQRMTCAFDLRIERLNQLVQLAPRRDVIDLSEETVTPRELFSWRRIRGRRSFFA